ncbi:hypothetical protein LXL04_007526 [Taraxacum kok-saghyz]
MKKMMKIVILCLVWIAWRAYSDSYTFLFLLSSVKSAYSGNWVSVGSVRLSRSVSELSGCVQSLSLLPDALGTIWLMLFLGIPLLKPDCEASYRGLMAYRVYSIASESFHTIYFHSSNVELVPHALQAYDDCD